MAMITRKSVFGGRMKISLLILTCFLLGLLNADALTKMEGESILIKCSHSNAQGNRKYFCRDPCANKDILVSSDKKSVRFSINDTGNVFYVTISELVEADTGTYWCGVDRVGVDTYNRVDLEVLKNEDEQGKITDVPSETSPSSSKTVVYIGAGLGTCFVVLIFCIFFFHLQRRRASSAGSDEKTNRRFLNSSQDQNAVIYSDVAQKDTTYSNINTQPQNHELPTEDLTYCVVSHVENTRG